MGSDYERIEDIKDVEKLLLSSSEEFINESFKIIIINFEDINNSNYYKLEAICYNKKCNQFIIKKDDFFKNNNIEIKIKLKDIKLKMINGINYLQIKNYAIINKNFQNHNFLELFEFNLPKLVQNSKPIESQRNIAIKLKSKETDLISFFIYKFYDNFNNEIKIESLNDFLDEIENEKIYLFNGFNYNSDNNFLTKTNISSIEIIDKNSCVENINFIENIEIIENNQIISFKGYIKDLEIETFTVLIEEINTKIQLKVNLNLYLIKKINQSYECQFINFKKENNNIFTITQFSDIFSNNDTYVELTFLDYSSKYYNRIRVDNFYVDIDKEKIKFKLEGNDKPSIFEQKFIYELIINDKIESSYEFILEIYKNKINYFSSFLKRKGGYTYQLYFQSKKKEYLPTSIKLRTDIENFIYFNHFENSDNSLNKRITIINADKQDFTRLNKNESSLDEIEVIDNDHNLKIYFLIKENNESNNNNFIYENNNLFGINNKFFVFNLMKNNNDHKEYFTINAEENKLINELYNDYIRGYNKVDNDKINELFFNKKMKQYFEEGLKKYIFINTKYNYIIIKKLSFLYLYYLFFNNFIRLNNYSYNLGEIIKKINCTEYLSRIQILLYFLKMAELKNPLDDYDIIDIYEEKRNQNNYRACFNAFKQFFKIIDNQKENSSFYQLIHQFNGKLKYDRIRGILMYSGSIFSLKDIKFELIKNINRFCFINMNKSFNSCATFSPIGKIITFYPMTFMLYEEYQSLELQNKISTAFLFLIFHEICRHFKTHLNNTILSPLYFIDDNLNLIIYKEFYKYDSCNIFEYILTGHYINPKSIIKSNDSEKLYDIKYYIQPNFNELKHQLNKLSSNIFDESIFIDNKDKTKVSGKFKGKKNYKNYKLPDRFMKQLSEAEKNLNEYNYHSLFPLFEIPQGISREEFNELLKDNIVYQKFLKVLPPEDLRY